MAFLHGVHSEGVQSLLYFVDYFLYLNLDVAFINSGRVIFKASSRNDIVLFINSYKY